MDSHLISDEEEVISSLLLEEEQRIASSSFLHRCSVVIRRFFRLLLPTSLKKTLLSQQRLFQRFVVSPVQFKRFPISGGREALNYVEVLGAGREYEDEEVQRGKVASEGMGDMELLLVHGYGSGLAMFFDNYDKFAQQFSRVVAVDWRGMGASSREEMIPRPHSCCCCTCCCHFDETEAVDYFIDALHEFIEGVGLKKFILAGHSLGGYLSARYAMKYYDPQSKENPLRGLILFSPAGLEPRPKQVVPPRRVSWKVATTLHLLHSHWTPQGIIRSFGPFGPRRVFMLVSRRFGSGRWSETDSEAISSYLYHISAQERAGEDALNAILQVVITYNNNDNNHNNPSNNNSDNNNNNNSGVRPRVLTRKPLTPPDLATLRGVPMLVLFGDSDWMHFSSAKRFADELTERFAVPTTFRVIRNAGHHLYMDNAGQFHSVIGTWMQNAFHDES